MGNFIQSIIILLFSALIILLIGFSIRNTFISISGELKEKKKNGKAHILSGLVSPKWWICFILLSMGSYYFCNSKIRNLEQDYAIRTADYAYAKKELSDLETQLARGGTICNDGWKSNSSGQGTCSYHGGVNQDIDENRYKTLSSIIRRYETDVQFNLTENELDKLRSNYFIFQIFIFIGLLWVYMFFKNYEPYK